MALDGPSPLRVTTEQLATVLEAAEIVRSESTVIAGALRILKIDGAFFVQEKTPDGQILLRPRPSSAEAAAFVDRRLLAYERMWDG